MSMDFEEELPSTEEVAKELINDWWEVGYNQWKMEQELLLNETEWEEHMDEMEIEPIMEEHDIEQR
tara:strand:- start:74 stop:271 length:198 start_codon:yes stop_codon:yes gene_type:complete